MIHKMMDLMFFFLAGTVGVILLNTTIVVASRTMSHRLAYVAGTLAGALIGMTLGARLK